MNEILQRAKDTHKRIIKKLNNCKSIRESRALNFLYESVSDCIEDFNENPSARGKIWANIQINSTESALASIKANPIFQK